MALLRGDILYTGVVALCIVPGEKAIKIHPGLLAIEEAARIGRSGLDRTKQRLHKGVVIGGVEACGGPQTCV